MNQAFRSSLGGIERSLEDLAAEARYHRQRLDLYRARMYGSGDTSESHFRELRRAWELAEERLATARRAAAAPTPGDRPPG